jgi:hypothetical protein
MTWRFVAIFPSDENKNPLPRTVPSSFVPLIDTTDFVTFCTISGVA